MNCCNEMDFERDERREYGLLVKGKVSYLRVSETGHCDACGAGLVREAQVDCDVLVDEEPEDSFEVVEVDRTCGTCGGSGGIPEAPCGMCGGRGVRR